MRRHSSLRVRVCTALATLTAVVISGCSPSAQPPETPPSTGPTYLVRSPWIWDAVPGINLFDRDMEVIRATVEGDRYSTELGGHPERSFPGLATAIADSDPNLIGDLGSPSDEESGARRRARPPVNHYAHVYEHTADNNRTTIKFCEFSIPTVAHDTGIFSLLSVVTVAHTPGRTGTPGIPDTGQLLGKRSGLQPDWDVFTPWTIVRNHRSRDINDNAPQSCINRITSVVPPTAQRVYPNYWLTADKKSPTLPLQQQFPRWIGPTRID